MAKRHILPYGRARLFLGITNIGFWVLFALTALHYDLPGQYLPSERVTALPLLLALAKFLGGYVLLQAPFDYLGGYLIPNLYERYYRYFSDFIADWMRGVLIQTALLFGIALTLLHFSQYLVLLVLGWFFFLLLFQLVLARVIGNFEARGENGWKSMDDAFTGGVAGLPGFQKAIFVTGRGQRIRAMDERRRQTLQKMSLPAAGLVIAMAYNLIGLLLTTGLLIHPLETVSGVAELAFRFTLWSFLGLLILPSLSRPAVYGADYAMYAKGVTEEEFAGYLEFATSQNDEGARSRWIESIFYPIPSAANRLARWGRPPIWSGGWHCARYAIYLSWTGLSLLSRSVHCNVGKPDVWVMLPCD